MCMRSASVGILCLCEALAGVVVLATGAVSMAMSRFSAAASAACVLAKRWHRSVRMARRGAAALVHDIAADIGCEGWAGACRGGWCWGNFLRFVMVLSQILRRNVNVENTTLLSTYSLH